MKLDTRAFALAVGILWGAAVFFVAVAHLIWPPYGGAFLSGVASVYPGYTGGQSAAQVFLGTGYAFLDAGIAGSALAWLYNCLSRR
jgi:hypothetical protein